MILPPDDLRKAQLLMLKILKEVHRVCEENGIRYFLSDGTLIGAVRHNGFIPWDDDLDIGMLREDYEKFIDIAPKKFGKEFCLQIYKTDCGYGHQFGKVLLSGTKWIEQVAIRTSRLFSGIYIDIFPYDKIPTGRLKQEFLSFTYKFWKSQVLIKQKYVFYRNIHGFFHKSYFIVKKAIGLLFSLDYSVRKRDSICMRYKDRDKNFCITKYGGNFWKNQNRPESFATFVLHTFEDSEFYIPSDYDSILTNLYGDYMMLPPPEKRCNHGIVEYDFGDYL